MIFAPVSHRRGRPENLLAAPRLSWAGVFVYRVTQDGGERVGASRTARRSCSAALFRAGQDGAARVTQSGAARTIFNV